MPRYGKSKAGKSKKSGARKMKKSRKSSKATPFKKGGKVARKKKN